MTIFFPDLSKWDAERGITIQPGTVAVIARATLSTTYADWAYSNFKSQAAAVGAVFGAYHWLNDNQISAQASWCYQHVGPNTPLMIDAEDVAGNTGFTRFLTVSHIVEFTTAYRALGGTVHVVYLPHWYWQNDMGSPDLQPLADAGLVLVSSAYTEYSDTGPGWSAYGGMVPAIWQYTDALPYGLSSCDFNAFRGTINELSTLMHGKESAMTLSDIDAQALIWRVEALTSARDAVLEGPTKGEQVKLAQVVKAIQAKVDALTVPQPAPVDVPTLVAALQPVMEEAAEAAVRRALGSLDNPTV